jgi:hypothetical protein
MFGGVTAYIDKLIGVFDDGKSATGNAGVSV